MTKYYSDTGRFPDHIPTHADERYHTLMKNPKGSNAIKGWDGPFIEKEFQHPFNLSAYREIRATTAASHQFDLDGDGTKETGTTSYIRVNGLTAAQAESLSNMIDQDGGETSGSKSWWLSGQVKTYNDRAVTTSNIIIIYLGKA